MLISWDLAFGAGGSHVPCGPSSSGQRQKLCQCQEACVWTPLASGISTPIPQSCLLSALPSRVWWRHAQHYCSVM